MKKKAVSLFMAAVMIATTPASVTLASDSTVETVVVSEVESETTADAEEIADEESSMETEAETASAKEASATNGGADDAQIMDATEAATDADTEDTASDSVGTDEEPGVSEEEIADAAETTEAAAVETEAESEAATEVKAESDAETDAGVAAAGLEADTEGEESAVSEELPFLEFDYDSMVTSYELLAGNTDPITFEVLLSSYVGTLSYQWYIWDEDEDEYESISDAVGSTYTITPPSEAAWVSYYCEVTAETSEGKSVSSVAFHVYVSEDMVINYTYYNKVTPGGDISLGVEADSPYSTITYKWYIEDTDDYSYTLISGETDSTLSLSEVYSSAYYRCVVSDGYTTSYAYFYVYVDSGLTLNSVEITSSSGNSYSNDSWSAYLFTIDPEESATMSVDAVTDYGEIAYQWYYLDSDYNYSPIEGETGSSYTVSEAGSYKCMISDDYNSGGIYFEIYVNSGLDVDYASSYDFTLEPGETAEMSVSATSDYKSSITYQWYHYQNGSYVEIEDETSSAITVSAAGDYYCKVSDGYSSMTIWFYVTVENELELEYDSDVYVTKGSTAVMTVTASAIKEGFSYEWYYYDADGTKVVLDETSNTLELDDVADGDEYYCLVSDEYGNSCSACFYIEIESSIALSYEDYYEVGLNESVTLSIRAESSEGEITYQWYIWDDDEDGYVALSGETSSSLTVTPTLTYTEYKCAVSDGVTTRYAWIEVEIDTGFSASADQAGYLVTSGSSVTLSVSATTEEGTLSYSWYYYDDDYDRVSAGNSSSLSLTNLTTSRYYYCYVSNGYTSSTIYFKVTVVSEIGETATSFSAAKTMTAGTSQVATIATGGAYMYYKIVPTTTGSYTFYTTGDEDTYGYLYDSSENLLTLNDDADNGLNFQITYTLTAGTTYYLGVRYYSSSNVGTFNVYMVSGSSICSHANTTHTSAKAATCTAAGNIEYWTCSDCGAKFSDSSLTTMVSDVTIAATGHTASSTWTTTKAATCTTAGTKVQKCTKCGAVVNTATIAATGHSYGEWTTTTEATVSAEGTMTRTCSKCNATETKSIAKLTPTIKVNATSLKLKVKQSTTAFKVSGLANGDKVASYKSSNTKIVTVNSKGKITAKNKTGTAYITVTLKSGLKKKIKVTVQKTAVKTTKITVASKKVSIKKGKTYTIKPTISPITSVQKVTYTSSNKKVATVNSKGKITAKKKGTATITVKSGSKSVKIKVTVK